MAIFLTPVSWRRLWLSNVCNFLLDLAHALIERSERFERHEGIKYAIEYLRFLRGSTLDSFRVGVRRDFVTALLVWGLRIQIQIHAGNGDGTRDIKEMVVLCRELLTSDISTSFPEAAFTSLHVAADLGFLFTHPIELQDEIVECLRGAVRVCPLDSFPTLLALAEKLLARFMRTHTLDDYEEAMALLENILHPNRPGGCPDSIRGLASTLATRLMFTRFATFNNPEYLEVAISRLRVELSSPSINELDRVEFSEMLSNLVKARFRDYNLSESIEEANSNSSQIVSLSSSQTREKSGRLLAPIEDVQKTYSTVVQQKIQYFEELLSNTSPGTERHTACLSDLAEWYKSKFCCTNDTSDIDESIKYGRLTLNATYPNDPTRFGPLFSLRDILLLAFEKSGKISYLDESITVGYDILESGNFQDSHFKTVLVLVWSLCMR